MRENLLVFENKTCLLSISHSKLFISIHFDKNDGIQLSLMPNNIPLYIFTVFFIPSSIHKCRLTC